MLKKMIDTADYLELASDIVQHPSQDVIIGGAKYRATAALSESIRRLDPGYIFAPFDGDEGIFHLQLEGEYLRLSIPCAEIPKCSMLNGEFDEIVGGIIPEDVSFYSSDRRTKFFKEFYSAGNCQSRFHYQVEDERDFHSLRIGHSNWKKTIELEFNLQADVRIHALDLVVN